MEASHLSHDNCLQIMRTAGDGHCLLYAIIISCTVQLPKENPPSIHMLKCVIFMESLENRDIYMEYLHNVDTYADFALCVSRYLLQKHYNNNFGDLIPVMIANALSLSLQIKDIGNNNEVNHFVIPPRTGQNSHSVIIRRANEHFSGVNIKSPSSTDTSKRVSGVKPLKYSRSKLLHLNCVSHRIERKVRKTLFKNSLWQPALLRTACASSVSLVTPHSVSNIVKTTRDNMKVNHHLLRSLPKVASVHKRNILRC